MVWWSRLREAFPGAALENAWGVVSWLGMLYCTDRYVFHLSMTHGPSMMPTLNEMGDVVLVDKLSPRLWNPIQRNDVVVADSSYKADFSVCKRVVGLPGDVVIPAGSWHGIVVPPGHVWIEGDNPQNSVDSRSYGPVPVGTIQGRVVARVWPLPHARWITRHAPRPDHNALYLQQMLQDEQIAEDVQKRLQRRRAAEAEAAARHQNVEVDSTEGIEVAEPAAGVGVPHSLLVEVRELLEQQQQQPSSTAGSGSGPMR